MRKPALFSPIGWLLILTISVLAQSATIRGKVRAPSGATLGGAVATVTITDDDPMPVVHVEAPATAVLEFEERPSECVIRDALDRLREAGIPCHFGRWLVPGRPRVRERSS